MDGLSLIKNKLEALQEEITNISASKLDDKASLEAQLELIKEFEKVIVDEALIRSYDFSDAINLVNSYDYKIDNIAQIIADIKSVFEVREELNLSRNEMPLDSSQATTFREFTRSLAEIKKNIVGRIQELEKNSGEELQNKISNLEAIKNIFEGSGPRKYYTEDMLRTFWEEIDVLNLPAEERKSLLDMFYETRNINSSHKKEAVPFEDIIALYREYFSDDTLKRVESILSKYKDEITVDIDLDNTREILEFFKEKNLLDKFTNLAKVKVSVYGKADYIRDTIYDKIMNYDENNRSAFFKDDLASVWIKVPGSNTRSSRPFRTSSNGSGERKGKGDDSLYSSSHKIDYDEFLQNIKILQDNSDLFGSKFNCNNLGSNLALTSQPTGSLKKNIELCKLFNLGQIYPIPVSAFNFGSLEDKLHLAVELGLLKSPMTEYFQNMDKDINKNYEFKGNATKKGFYNQTIRNYYERYMSKLGFNSINYYAYMFYKLQRQNYISFYNSFFSTSRAGMASNDFVDTLDEDLFTDEDKMNMFIESNFMIDRYSDRINGFDEYDSVISSDNAEKKTADYTFNDYYDPSILSDPLIMDLEENYTVNDLLTSGDDLVEQKNEYVYMFGDRLISRYKVLHNASILKAEYGELNRDMLMTSIVRNSFLDEKTYQRIENCVWKRGLVL